MALKQVSVAALAIAVLSVGATSVAHAAVYSAGQTVILSDLISSGSTIDVGGITFSNFQATPQGDMPDPDSVVVAVTSFIASDGSVAYGFELQDAFLDQPGGSGSTFKLTYSVVTDDPSAALSESYLHEVGITVGTGTIGIASEFDSPGSTAYSSVSTFPSPIPPFNADTESLASVSSIQVTTTIAAATGSNGGAILTLADQGFVVGLGATPPVPEPASLGLLGLGAIGLLKRRRV